MKQEILERLETEVKACKRYAENGVKKAKEGKIGLAINFLDIAQTAKKCANQAHEDIWEVSQGKLTDEEFELFAEAETLDRELQRAYEEIKRARK
ncbi:transcriptional regulator [Peptoniphilus porci]|uniref:Transcriptional regulator n=1 Tax=Peptoniphilus porci TaxID=2652280 RepID=A0A1U7M0I4_9FIRM|nr:transcriptional regulator [Peptoniphilus porci]OLR65181.1 transcriptional regulator [Peptoniphilus porci]